MKEYEPTLFDSSEYVDPVIELSKLIGKNYGEKPSERPLNEQLHWAQITLTPGLKANCFLPYVTPFGRNFRHAITPDSHLFESNKAYQAFRNGENATWRASHVPQKTIHGYIVGLPIVSSPRGRTHKSIHIWGDIEDVDAINYAIPLDSIAEARVYPREYTEVMLDYQRVTMDGLRSSYELTLRRKDDTRFIRISDDPERVRSSLEHWQGDVKTLTFNTVRTIQNYLTADVV